MNQKNSDITAVIIAKNEEERISRCLESLSWTDERIVIDNGSTDRTVGVAKKAGANVIQAGVENNFAQLRNIGAHHAQNSWIFYVDADEEVTPKLKEEIIKIVHDFSPNQHRVAYFVKRKNFYLGHTWPYMDRMERLFWKKGLIEWTGEIHESPRVKGSVGQLHQPLLHHTHRTLEEMVNKTNIWSEIEADLRVRASHPPIVAWRLIRVMITGFIDSFVKQGGWRAGVRGWIESIFQSYSAFITYAKLWEKQNKKSQ